MNRLLFDPLYRPGDMVDVGTQVVEKIADREGVDPVELAVPLYDVIDADALDLLTNGNPHERPRTPLRIEFTYMGYEVHVDGEGNVRIDENPELPTAG